ncbi:FAD-dependent oxidoreductase [uncultured Roseovarius sp.]|uniref:FAD-dependent oxidoreductase n=1 Tax=uncultured Roseovarius sp. TaxID=293344 RepID=UPI00260D6142|nr:FAD-dependent oxidoreductase [uncultured Roseovarius sp.]
MIAIAGAGLAGLACALELLQRGAKVTLFERSEKIGANSVARFAGGMLAPWCERESAEETVITLGANAADWWARVTKVNRTGTLVLAPPRDRSELARFARRTRGYTQVLDAGITELESDLSGRFPKGLFFAEESHLNPRQALANLADAIGELGGEIRLGTPAPAQVDLDCTGMAAPLTGLRAVRGEMAILHCPAVSLTRTVRLLHPRIPLYLVPRGDSIYMLGATMVESDSTRPPTARALMELLGAAYALHPAFAEASVVETGAGLRPAFDNNLPRLIQQNGTLHLNGLYRHGFLLAPALAREAANQLLPETPNENPHECQTV